MSESHGSQHKGSLTWEREQSKQHGKQPHKGAHLRDSLIGPSPQQ